jgi:hypothetical protein
MTYLDRVYQSNIVDLKTIEKRLENLVCKSNKHKRSHSYEYLPKTDCDMVSNMRFDEEVRKEYGDLTNFEDKKNITKYLTSQNPKQLELDKLSRLNDNRKSSNLPFQGKADSFAITSANNSFVREYTDHEWYSSKPMKKSNKRQAQTPGTHDTDQHNSKVYTRGSDLSFQNDQSRYHRRIASEDLILEESSDVPKIEFQKEEPTDIDQQIGAILKDLRFRGEDI